MWVYPVFLDKAVYRLACFPVPSLSGGDITPNLTHLFVWLSIQFRHTCSPSYIFSSYVITACGDNTGPPGAVVARQFDRVLHTSGVTHYLLECGAVHKVSCLGLLGIPVQVTRNLAMKSTFQPQKQHSASHIAVVIMVFTELCHKEFGSCITETFDCLTTL